MLALGFAQAAQAGVTAPCTALLISPDVGPAVSAGGQYCTDSYGASDTWFKPSVPNYQQNKDFLSGDDAAFLRWDNMPGTTAFLTPNLDAGRLVSSYATGSGWTVTAPLAGVGTDTTTSTISLALGGGGSVDVAITTHINADGSVVQHYDVTNNSSQDLNNLSFGDLFNFHPNGSTAAGSLLGTTVYQNGEIVTTGNPSDPGFLGNGRMFLTLNNNKVLPTAWDVIQYDRTNLNPPGLTAINEVDCLVAALPGACFNNASGPLTGDVAGLLAYNAGGLRPGGTLSFDIEKPLPEPTTLLLMLFGVPLLRRFSGPRP
jgi:hypothetical protein